METRLIYYTINLTVLMGLQSEIKRSLNHSEMEVLTGNITIKVHAWVMAGYFISCGVLARSLCCKLTSRNKWCNFRPGWFLWFLQKVGRSSGRRLSSLACGSVEIGHLKRKVTVKDNVSVSLLSPFLLLFFVPLPLRPSLNPQDWTNYPQFHKHAFRAASLCLWHGRVLYP